MCDTLVALGNSTEDGNIIFGKNSDRPQSEAQLITFSPRNSYSKGDQVKCTYISIPQIFGDVHRIFQLKPGNIFISLSLLGFNVRINRTKNEFFSVFSSCSKRYQLN